MIIVAGLVAAVVIILLMRPWNRRACRWREDRTFRGSGARYVCVACGAVEVTEGKAPRRCHAQRS